MMALVAWASAQLVPEACWDFEIANTLVEKPSSRMRQSVEDVEADCGPLPPLTLARTSRAVWRDIPARLPQGASLPNDCWQAARDRDTSALRHCRIAWKAQKSLLDLALERWNDSDAPSDTSRDVYQEMRAGMKAPPWRAERGHPRRSAADTELEWPASPESWVGRVLVDRETGWVVEVVPVPTDGSSPHTTDGLQVRPVNPAFAHVRVTGTITVARSDLSRYRPAARGHQLARLERIIQDPTLHRRPHDRLEHAAHAAATAVRRPRQPAPAGTIAAILERSLPWWGDHPIFDEVAAARGELTTIYLQNLLELDDPPSH